jgi:hypothetical protein
MPKVPWRVGRVVNIRHLTSLFPRVGPSGRCSGSILEDPGEFGPELSFVRSPAGYRSNTTAIRLRSPSMRAFHPVLLRFLIVLQEPPVRQEGLVVTVRIRRLNLKLRGRADRWGGVACPSLWARVTTGSPASGPGGTAHRQDLRAGAATAGTVGRSPAPRGGTDRGTSRPADSTVAGSLRERVANPPTDPASVFHKPGQARLRHQGTARNEFRTQCRVPPGAAGAAGAAGCQRPDPEGESALVGGT